MIFPSRPSQRVGAGHADQEILPEKQPVTSDRQPCGRRPSPVIEAARIPDGKLPFRWCQLHYTLRSNGIARRSRARRSTSFMPLPILTAELGRWNECSGFARASAGSIRSGVPAIALVALGPSSYLEIICAGPAPFVPLRRRPFGLEALGSSRLVGWAAKGSGLTNFRAAAARHGVELGKVLSGRRKQADGTVLNVEVNGFALCYRGWNRAVLHRLGEIASSSVSRFSRCDTGTS